MVGESRPSTQAQIMQNFAEETVDKVKKVDINIFPEELVPVYYSKALLNVVKLWLLSGPYDRVRRPDWAGFFTKLLREYSMDDAGAKEIESKLRAEIQAKIAGVELTDVTAIPLLGKKMWEVGVGAIDNDTGVFVENTKDNYLIVKVDPNAGDEVSGMVPIINIDGLTEEDSGD